MRRSQQNFTNPNQKLQQQDNKNHPSAFKTKYRESNCSNQKETVVKEHLLKLLKIKTFYC